MKKVFIFLITISWIQCATAQSCLPNGISFSTQSQIDNFQTNYPGCTQIEGDVQISGDYITNLDGLSVLTSIEGILDIHSNPDLTSITGLNNLTSTGAGLYIIYNPNLTSLVGLNNLTSIWGDLRIMSNGSLTTLSGMDNINFGSIAGLYIQDNSLLSTCQAQSICNYLANPNGPVNIYNNATGCNTPPEVANNCGINLPCLPYGNYYFVSQADIDNFQVNYPNCTQLEGDVTIGFSDLTITNLNGLSEIKSIGWDFNILQTDSLINLSGLDSLSSVGRRLFINDNLSLNTLSGLINLTSIGGSIDIESNPSLTSLSGLDNIEAGAIMGLSICYNYSLSMCHVQSICDYLVNPNGTTWIYSNATGCNSKQEVELACGVGMQQNNLIENNLNIYLNPTSTNIMIETDRKGYLSILNLNSQELIIRKITEHETLIDISNLPGGVYIFRYENADTVKTGKIIKQ